MRFVCGYVHMEWQFDLYITLQNDAQAIKWFQDRFDDDCKDIENGII